MQMLVRGRRNAVRIEGLGFGKETIPCDVYSLSDAKVLGAVKARWSGEHYQFTWAVPEDIPAGVYRVVPKVKGGEAVLVRVDGGEARDASGDAKRKRMEYAGRYAAGLPSGGEVAGCRTRLSRGSPERR
jgi:hypothetical protein